MNVAARVRGRLELSQRMLGLLVGDLTAITLFVVVGEITHGIDPIAQAGYVVSNTLAPFVVGWLVVAIPAGVYAGETAEALPRVALRAAGAWLGADIIAQTLRSTQYVQGGATLDAILVFGAISFVVGGGMLVCWRVGVAVVSARRRSTALA